MNVTQKELAERLKLKDPSYIAKLETGTIDNPKIDSIQKIAEALDVAVSELTGEVGGEMERAIMSSDMSDEDKRVFLRLYRMTRPDGHR